MIAAAILAASLLVLVALASSWSSSRGQEVIVNGILAWLTQLHVAFSVLAAIASNKPAPARQVVIYTLVLIALAFTRPQDRQARQQVTHKE